MSMGIQQLKQFKILLIGDVCTDVYHFGLCERMSPEAPVPIFIKKYTKTKLGMAGNVYQNVIALGTPATLKTNQEVIEKKRFVDEQTNHMFLRVDTGDSNVKRIKKIRT